MMDPPAALKGVPFEHAVCIDCGHKGRSQQPKHYLCTGCYCERHASGNLRKAANLRERIAKLEAEAKVYQERAEAFRKKHPKKKSNGGR